MSTDLPEPVAGELEAFGYRPPRLRITATYDNDGATRLSSLDVEIHDDSTLAPAVIRQIVTDVAHVLTNLSVPSTAKPVTTGSWTSGGHAQLHTTEGGAAA